MLESVRLKTDMRPALISSGVTQPLPWASNILKVSIKLKSVLKDRSILTLSSFLSRSSCDLNKFPMIFSSSSSFAKFSYVTF